MTAWNRFDFITLYYSLSSSLLHCRCCSGCCCWINGKHKRERLSVQIYDWNDVSLFVSFLFSKEKKWRRRMIQWHFVIDHILHSHTHTHWCTCGLAWFWCCISYAPTMKNCLPDGFFIFIQYTYYVWDAKRSVFVCT